LATKKIKENEEMMRKTGKIPPKLNVNEYSRG
jgi:hypothetical protein